MRSKLADFFFFKLWNTKYQNLLFKYTISIHSFCSLSVEQLIFFDTRLKYRAKSKYWQFRKKFIAYITTFYKKSNCLVYILVYIWRMIDFFILFEKYPVTWEIWPDILFWNSKTANSCYSSECHSNSLDNQLYLEKQTEYLPLKRI